MTEFVFDFYLKRIRYHWQATPGHFQISEGSLTMYTVTNVSVKTRIVSKTFQPCTKSGTDHETCCI